MFIHIKLLNCFVPLPTYWGRIYNTKLHDNALEKFSHEQNFWNYYLRRSICYFIAASIISVLTGQNQEAEKMLHELRESDRKLDQLSGKTVRDASLHLQLYKYETTTYF